MSTLSRNTLKQVAPQAWLSMPAEDIFSLPEKVLQFGTGVLLRGLPDYFIDKANRNGIFNGRIVVVKSTASGGTDSFETQDGLYTQVIRGIEAGKQVDKMIVNSAVSRVLTASSQWKEILACAANAEMKVIISNTTEVGISLLSGDQIDADPPKSFPGKLLAFLWERFKIFGGSPDSGFVIIPTELIPDNAIKLRDIVLQLAQENNCSEAFKEWILQHNYFCSSLVDRIVPGKLSGKDLEDAEEKLGYKDDLLIMSEVFRLWAIECTHTAARDILSFSQVDEGVVLTEDLEKFRELKLRLLNGTHTLSCAYAFLSGFNTVGEAMRDDEMSLFITRMAIDEIAPAIVSDKITYQEACAFASSVFDRFRNPFLVHKWISIAAQYTSKIKMRVIPILQNHYRHASKPPQHIALGIASYLLMLRVKQGINGQYEGVWKGNSYILQDDDVEIVSAAWEVSSDPGEVVNAVFSKTEYWNADLLSLPGLTDAITAHLEILVKVEAGVNGIYQPIQ